MRRLKIENDNLKSKIVIPVKKVDCGTNCEYTEECEKCHEKSKVCLFLVL